MKFLYFTDPHASSRGPSSRTDNYVDALMEKLDELNSVVKKENIEAVFCGGDLFDKPVVSLNLTGQIANKIRESGVPWYVVPGNHDLFGYNISSLPQTSLGLLERTGVISILDRKAGVIEYTNQHGETFSFEGQEYHMDIDKRDPSQDYFVTSNADYKVLIPHSMLLDKEYFPEVPYTKTDDLAGKTEADLILVGHFHDGFKANINNNGKNLSILNPGSTMRDEASKGNLTRIPQYIIVSIDPTLSASIHPFQCAKPGKDIFDRSHITNKQVKNRYLQNFEQKLTDIQLNAVDVRDVLNEIIQNDNSIDKEISTAAQNRLTDAEQITDDITKQMSGYQEKPQNIGISKIEIKGFQSHEDTKIEFAEGLNAIVGPSDSGKSSVIRALRFVLYNEPRGADFIRQAESRATVSVTFTDGHSLTRSRTRNSAGEYILRAPDGSEKTLKGFTNNVPVDVPNLHQMPQIQLAKDIETSLNIGMQLEAPFLIGESASTRANIIGRLTGVNLVDTSLREINRDVLGNNRDIKTYNKQISDIHDELSQFSDLEELEAQIQSADSKIKMIEYQERMKLEYQEIQDSLDEATYDINEYTQDLKAIEALTGLAPVVEQLENLYEEYETLEELNDDLNKAFRDIQLLEAEIHAVRAVESSLGDVSQLEEMVSDLAVYNELQNDIIKVTSEESDINFALSNIPTISEEDIHQIESLLEEKVVIQSLLNDLKDNRIGLVQLRKDIKQARMDEQKAEHKYQHILEENGTCPTCNQTIERGSLING